MSERKHSDHAADAVLSQPDACCLRDRKEGAAYDATQHVRRAARVETANGSPGRLLDRISRGPREGALRLRGSAEAAARRRSLDPSTQGARGDDRQHGRQAAHS
eukprot:1881579-Prymnesium_polylepis.1